MKTKELKIPVRIYWDLGTAPGGNAAFYQDVCDEIIDNKVLSLSLTEPGDFLSSACFSVLECLSSEMIALSLTLPLSALDPRSIGVLRHLKLRKLLVTVSSVQDIKQLGVLFREVGTLLPLGLSFDVTRKNCIELAEVVSAAVENRMPEIVLPMQRLVEGQECFLMSPDDRRALTGALAVINRPDSLKITVHDPFLWRVFFPSINAPTAGCQAGDTMLYLSPGSDVYPCPSLPIKFGSLLHESLTEIIRSPKRKKLRKILAAPPRECNKCAEVDQCMGGCRGRTFAVTASYYRHDPACK